MVFSNKISPLCALCDRGGHIDHNIDNKVGINIDRQSFNNITTCNFHLNIVFVLMAIIEELESCNLSRSGPWMKLIINPQRGKTKTIKGHENPFPFSNSDHTSTSITKSRRYCPCIYWASNQYQILQHRTPATSRIGGR